MTSGCRSFLGNNSDQELTMNTIFVFSLSPIEQRDVERALHCGGYNAPAASFIVGGSSLWGMHSRHCDPIWNEEFAYLVAFPDLFFLLLLFYWIRLKDLTFLSLPSFSYLHDHNTSTGSPQKLFPWNKFSSFQKKKLATGVLYPPQCSALLISLCSIGEREKAKMVFIVSSGSELFSNQSSTTIRHSD